MGWLIIMMSRMMAVGSMMFRLDFLEPVIWTADKTTINEIDMVGV